MIAYVGNNPINFNDPSGLSAAAASMLLGKLGSWGRENAGTLAEIWIGFTPAGFYTDLYSAVAGRTPITGDSLSGWERVAILIPGVSEIRNAGRIGATALKDGAQLSTSKALDMAIEHLGPNYKEIASGVFKSADGTRMVRMTDSDLSKTGNHAGAPRMNFETG